MRILIIGAADDVRGARLAGAAADSELRRALADPSVGLIFVPPELAVDDDRVVVLPQGGSDAAARQHRGGVRRDS